MEIDRRMFCGSAAAMVMTHAMPSMEPKSPLKISIDYYWLMQVDNGKWLWQVRYKTNDGPMILEHGESSRPEIRLPNLSIWLDPQGEHQVRVEAECDTLRVGRLEL